MPHIKKKSESLLDTAERLKDYKLYNVIPHAAYYSCLLLSKFKVKDLVGIDYDQMAEEIRRNKENSHKYIIKRLRQYIAGSSQRPGTITARDYENSITELKTIREEADYENEPIDPIRCEGTVNKAKDLYHKINKIK